MRVKNRIENLLCIIVLNGIISYRNFHLNTNTGIFQTEIARRAIFCFLFLQSSAEVYYLNNRGNTLTIAFDNIIRHPNLNAMEVSRVDHAIES